MSSIKRTSDDVLALAFALLEIEAQAYLSAKDKLWEPPVDPLPGQYGHTNFDERYRRDLFDLACEEFDAPDGLRAEWEFECAQRLERTVQWMWREAVNRARKYLPRWVRAGALPPDMLDYVRRALVKGVLVQSEPATVVLYLECKQVIENDPLSYGKAMRREAEQVEREIEVERARVEALEAEEREEAKAASVASDFEFSEVRGSNGSLDHLPAEFRFAGLNATPTPEPTPGRGLVPAKVRPPRRRPAVVEGEREVFESTFDVAGRVRAWPKLPKGFEIAPVA